LVRKRGAHLQAIMVMLLTEAAQLIFSIFAALADLITDGIVFSHLLRGDLKVSNEAYTAAYATLLCFAVVANVISVAYWIRNARLVQTHVRQLAPKSHPLAAKEAHRLVQQHEWELAQTHRTKVTLLLSLLSVIVQGAPGSANSVRASAKLTGRRAPPICRCRARARSVRALRARTCEIRQAYPFAAAGLPMSVVNCCLIFVEGSTDKTVRAPAIEFRAQVARWLSSQAIISPGGRIASGLSDAAWFQTERLEAPSPGEPTADRVASGSGIVGAQGRKGGARCVARRCYA
jgi:hypothetical protein